jgi:hypothetical protein
MTTIVKASDLYYKYRRNTSLRNQPKFSAVPDPAPFDRDDLYEVLPMLGAVMSTLERDDMQSLHLLEELMIRELPGFITARDQVYTFLVECGRERLADHWHD